MFVVVLTCSGIVCRFGYDMSLVKEVAPGGDFCDECPTGILQLYEVVGAKRNPATFGANWNA